MLDINLEFTRGMLFVRLSGVLDTNTYTKLNDLLDKMIHEEGLKYFVVNLEDLSYIDDDGLKLIIDRYLDVVLHDGKLVICGYKDGNGSLEIKNVFKQIEHTNNELNAFRLINI